MNTIFLIAHNTFKETIRNKVLYNILFFALLIIFLSISFGEWSVFARSQVMKDFGLATMSITGLMLAVFVGVGMLGKEVSARTVYAILVRPIRRYQFIVGKFIGLLATLFLNFAFMSAVFLATLWYMGTMPDIALLYAIALIWVEMTVIVAVSILFSALTTPTLAAIFTLGFYIAGHYNDLLELQMMHERSAVFAWTLKAIYYFLPNLEHFNVRSRVVYGFGIDSPYVLMALCYGALYAALFLFCANLAFRRKDL
jgi:ABC-type transport system involved in multi-copper enzyme maturation permease subunit